MSLLSPWTIFLYFALCLVIAWFLKRPMNARVRRGAPGEFLALPNGVIHYDWHGPVEGPVLVMVHGLTTPSFIWRDQIPALTQAGYRVLTFDHFGRGFSDRPMGQQDLDFFVQELDGVLETLDVRAGYDLLGYSMGGGIVTQYAALRRDRIRRLILVAPIGLLRNQPNWIARWPVIGDLAMFVLGGWSLRRGAVKAGKAEGVDLELIELQRRETRYAGYTAAVLSSVRHTIYADLREAHRILLDRDMPILALFGSADDVIPIENAMRLREVNRSAQIVEVKGAGHGLVSTHPKQVNDAILAFLRS
jgi:pimeloyl-ACP methyl ester carboxylesterase